MIARSMAGRNMLAGLIFALGGGLAAAQGSDFDFGDARHGSYILPPGTTTIQQLWSDITGNAQGAYDPNNENQIPQFENFTISNGATLTTDAFLGDPTQPVDPALGGVIRFKVKGTLRIEAAGRVDASGKGYEGGDSAEASASGPGEQGDSWGVVSANSNLANRGGGGGGIGELILGNRQPQSGSGGGHAAAGNPGDPQLSGDAQPGRSFDDVAAELGATFSNAYPFPRFGSGGGAGGFANNFANFLARGGNGGGLVLVEAQFIINSGGVRADGSAGGAGLSGGGGGAGGSILIRTLSDLNGTVSVAGGAGGVGSWNPDSRGGAGSPGIRVWEQRFIIEQFVTGNGTIELEPDQEQYGEGDIVSVLAVPDPGWRFVRWELDLTTSANPAELEIDGPKEVRAVFEEPPVIVVQPSAPQVGPTLQSITFQVANEGGGVLNWIASVQDDPEGFVSIISQTPNLTAAGNGRFVVQVAANDDAASRQATLVVQGSDPDTAPQTATITQLGAVPELTVSPAVTNVGGSATQAVLTVQNTGTGRMPWTAVLTSGGDFAVISTGTSGVNAGSIVVALEKNPTLSPRTVTVEVTAPGAAGSPQTASLVQAGGEPLLSVAPQSQTVDSDPQVISFLVSNIGAGAMDWTAAVATGADFLSIADGANGTDTGIVSVQVAENNTDSLRTGTLRIDAPEADNTPIVLTVTQQARERVLLLSTTTLNAPATGGSIGFGVQNGGTGTMTWNATVTSGNEFITVAGSSGSGVNTGAVNLTIAENPKNQPRTGTVTVSAPGADDSPQVVTVTQAAQNIVLDVTPAEIAVGPIGGPVNFTVRNTGTGTMAWSAAVQSGADFATLISGSTGLNTGVVSLSIKENNTGLERVATVLVNAPEAGNSPITVTVRQAPSDNLLQVSPADIEVGSAGGPLSFTVQNGGTGTMRWTAVVETGADFLSVTPGTGSGTNTGVVSLSVQENTDDTPRAGTILVSAPEAANNPQRVAITQRAREAVLQVSPADLSVGALGGPLTFTVENAGTGTMNWTASVQTGGDFVGIGLNPSTGGSSGVGTNSGVVRLTVTENTTSNVRTATVLVGALGAANSPVTVTVTQAPRNAVLAINPSQLSVGAAGGPLSFTVQNAGTGTMTWSAAVQSGSDFLSIAAGTGVGTNTGTVSLAVVANTTGLARTGTVIVSAPGATGSPATITVTQSGGNNVLQVTPAELNVGASASAASFRVANGGTGSMNWVASVSSGAAFLSVVAGTGTGTNTGTVSLSLLENNTDLARTGTVIVEAPGADNSPLTVTVTQAPRAAVLLVNPDDLNADPAGGALSFTVENTGTGSMNWAASVQSGADFVRIGPKPGSALSSGFGTNTGTVELEVDENTTEAVRVATVQVQAVGAAGSPAAITVTQGPRNLILQVAPASRVLSAAAGEVQFDVDNAGSGTMNWTAAVSDGAGFLTIAAGTGSGANAGTIRVSVAENRSGAVRVGTLRVDAAGADGSPAIVSITQLAQDLQLEVAPREQTLGSDGGAVSFAVENRGTGSMSWTAVLEQGNDFAALGTAAGINTGAIGVTLSANRSGAPRTAIIRVDAPGAAGSPVRLTVNQAAVSAALRVTPLEQIVGARAGTATFQVENVGTGTMNWVASVTSGSNFVSIVSGGAGVNTAAIAVSIEENPGTADREASISVASPGAAGSPATLRIVQRARDAALRVTPANQNAGSAGGVVEFQIENGGAGALRWTASVLEGANFASITGPPSGDGDGTLQVTIAKNTDPLQRTARLQVEAAGAAGSPAVVTVTQALCELPRKAAGLSATDGAIDTAIELRWSEVAGATRYEIYRASVPDPFQAALIGSVEGAATRLYTDTTALPSWYERVGGGCLRPAEYDFTPRTYWYWIAAVNECGAGLFSEGDAGYRGVRLSNGIIVSEKALPPAAPGGLVRYAAPGDTLYVRLQHAAGVDADAIAAEVHAQGAGSAAPAWLPAAAEDAGGWVAIAPLDAWTPGDVVAVTVEAAALDGTPIDAAAAFEILAAPPKTAPIAQPGAEALGDLALDGVESGIALRAVPPGGGGAPGAIGSAYAAEPRAPFAAPQMLWLPVPAGVAPDAAALYAYIDDGTGAAWHPLDAVAGLMLPGSERIVESADAVWYGAAIHHGAIVQLAVPGGADLAAMGAVDAEWPEAGTLVVLLLMAVVLGARRGRAHRPGGKIRPVPLR